MNTYADTDDIPAEPYITGGGAIVWAMFVMPLFVVGMATFLCSLSIARVEHQALWLIPALAGVGIVALVCAAVWKLWQRGER